jgi:hypothetical protein
VAVTEQNPTVVDDVYVALSVPLATVGPLVGLIVPQAPAVVKVTRSPDTGPLLLVTVASRADVDVPLARIEDGVALIATATPLAGAGADTVKTAVEVVVPPPVLAEVKVNVQAPAA